MHESIIRPYLCEISHDSFYFKDRCPQIVTATGEEGAGPFLAQRLSITVERSNAANVLGNMHRGVD